MATSSIDKFIDYCEITCTKNLNTFTSKSSLTAEDIKKLTERISKQEKNYSRKRIVAIGFRLGLTASDVNHIMRACGRPNLYVRNLIELTLSYSLNAHSRCKLEYGESPREAVEKWWNLYQRAVEIYNAGAPKTDCLTKGPITLNKLKQFDRENRSVADDSIYHPVTADAIRMTSDVQKAVVATSADDFLEIVKALVPKLREQRSNARLIFVRYLYYYIEGMMQYYCGWRQGKALIASELFDHSVSSKDRVDQFIDQYKQGDYENLKISIFGVIKRMYLYYQPVGDGIVSGISEDDSGDEERKYLENEADYYTDVLRGTCDLTRERLLFFLTFVNSMLIRENILPDFQDDIMLDENRLNSILERCYGVVLSSSRDKLAMRILQIQHEHPEQSDTVGAAIDLSLYDLTQDVLERDDLADKKPMGPTTTNTYGGKLQKDIAGKPET